MQNNNQVAEREVLVATEKCAVHKFANKKRTRISSGSFQIQTVKESNHLSKELKTYYFKSKDFSQSITSSIPFVKIAYPKTTSFIFEQNQLVYSVSFRNEEPQLQKLSSILSDFVNMYTLESENMSPTLNEKIKEHCPQNLKENQIYGEPQKKVKAVGKAIGNILGVVNGLAVKPINKISDTIGDKKDSVYEEKVSEETKTKVSNIKTKSQTFNEKLSNAIKPAVDGYYNLSKKVGEKVYASDNFVIKAVRDYSLAFSNSMNEAEYKSRHPNGQQEEAPKQKQQQMKQDVTTAQLN